MTLIVSRRVRWAIAGLAAIIIAVGVLWAVRWRTSDAALDAAPDAIADHVHEAPAAADVRAPISLDARRQRLIGVRTVVAERTPLARGVRATGIVRYDEARLSDVNLKLDGWIEELFVDTTGQWVDRGAPLFSLYSPDLVATQQEYLQALRTRDGLSGSQIADARAYADQLVDAARRRLELWDLSADQIARLAASGQPETHMVFRSPAAGFVVEKSVVQGQRVMAGQSLYRLADLSVVWVEADLYEQDVPFVRVGDRATVTLDAYPGEPVSARVVYLYPFADAQARTVRARLSLGNARQRFRPGLYARVELQSSLGEGLTVPADALLDSGAEQVVFVAEGDGYFVPRRVTAGRRFDGRVEIRAGLSAGDVVAAGAAFFLDSESQLRASVPGFESSPPVADTAPRGAPADALAIELVTRPDPPRAGDNTFDVIVRDAAGAPVAGAEVTVALFMPAMPSMNMPAMRAEATLLDTGGGRYRGRVEVGMAGRWDVTITVRRDGATLGRIARAIVAR